MTTRQQQLLKKIGFNHLDHLERLSHDDALSLLALHALDVDNFDSHSTLKPQAGDIVKKCGGLPLALKAIGRLMRTKTEGEEWNDVLNSEIWNLESADEIVPALRLSYHDLSADLKQLFAYCSLFPKDFLFEKEELVLLWVAEGLSK
ncbi:putative P-loop containing nucleoside triphosphate hydrolase [Helianthus debilis subsp. tardiflorus]